MAAVFALVVAMVLVVGCGSEDTASKQGPGPAAGEPTGDAVLVGAGDVASCDGDGDEATAELLARIGGTVFVLGDGAYPDGSAADYADCYDPTWGRHKARTKPVPGNHDYPGDGGEAEGYFGYFGAAAGNRDKGYYSYELGGWHVVALNSNCEEVGGCGAGSPQVRWLKADLAGGDGACTLAYFHHPRFSSGEEHGGTPRMGPIWEALYAANADVVLSGHEHNYERFAPQTPGGEADPERGIREFVVGTGGNGHYPISDPSANSEVRNDDAYGVLKLTLHPESYDWRFVPVEGERFADSGEGRCH